MTIKWNSLTLLQMNLPESDGWMSFISILKSLPFREKEYRKVSTPSSAASPAAILFIDCPFSSFVQITMPLELQTKLAEPPTGTATLCGLINGAAETRFVTRKTIVKSWKNIFELKRMEISKGEE